MKRHSNGFQVQSRLRAGAFDYEGCMDTCGQAVDAHCEAQSSGFADPLANRLEKTNCLIENREVCIPVCDSVGNMLVA